MCYAGDRGARRLLTAGEGDGPLLPSLYVENMFLISILTASKALMDRLHRRTCLETRKQDPDRRWDRLFPASCQRRQRKRSPTAQRCSDHHSHSNCPATVQSLILLGHHQQKASQVRRWVPFQARRRRADESCCSRWQYTQQHCSKSPGSRSELSESSLGVCRGLHSFGGKNGAARVEDSSPSKN